MNHIELFGIIQVKDSGAYNAHVQRRARRAPGRWNVELDAFERSFATTKVQEPVEACIASLATNLGVKFDRYAAGIVQEEGHIVSSLCVESGDPHGLTKQQTPASVKQPSCCGELEHPP